MPISVVCDNCGRAYAADESLAGRRVRCRGCGTIVTIPSADAPSPLDLRPVPGPVDGPDALAATRAGTAFGARTAPPGESAPFPAEPEFDEHGPAPLPRGPGITEEVEITGEGIEQAGRANIRFNFAGAKELDLVLPWVLVAGSALWLLVQANRANTGPGWVVLTAAVFWTAAYTLVIAPITFTMLRQAGRSVGFQLPRTARFRTFACYFPALVLTATLWMMGHGAFAAGAIGVLGGLLLASLCVWVLFRLRPEEVPATSGFGAAGYVIGLAVCGAVFFGVNQLARSVVESTGATATLPVSPLGPGFGWAAPVDRPAGAGATDAGRARTRIARAETVDPNTLRNTAPVETGPKGPPPASAEVISGALTAWRAALDDGLPRVPVLDLGPQVPRPASPLVADFSVMRVREPVDRWFFPYTPSRFFAAVRRPTGEASVITWYDATEGFRRVGQVSFRPQSGDERYALSPDGKWVARLATAPSLSVELWSNGARLPERIPLDATTSGSPTLLGFVSEDRILVRWDGGALSGLELLDATARRRLRVINLPAVEREQAIATSPGGRFFAVATRDTDDADRPAELRVFAATGESDRAAQRIRITDLAPQWPVAPTGMAFLPGADRREDNLLAVLFEPGGAALLLAYRQQTGGRLGPALTDTGGKLFRPMGGFSGSAVHWIADGRNRYILVYGSAVVDPVKGDIVAEIDAGAVASIVPIDATTCLFFYRVEGMAAPLPVRVRFDASRIGATP